LAVSLPAVFCVDWAFSSLTAASARGRRGRTTAGEISRRRTDARAGGLGAAAAGVDTGAAVGRTAGETARGVTEAVPGVASRAGVGRAIERVGVGDTARAGTTEAAASRAGVRPRADGGRPTESARGARGGMSAPRRVSAGDGRRAATDGGLVGIKDARRRSLYTQ
jgi:hypothetical protein